MSREGVQQGDVIASFLFTLLYAPVLLNIFNRIHALCSSVQLFAILDDITFTGPAHLSEEMFEICSQELASVNILTVPRKTHLLINDSHLHTLPANLNPEIQIHTDGIALLGTAIGNDEFLSSFLDNKLEGIKALLSKVSKLQSLHSKLQILKLSVNAKLRHLLRSLMPSRQPVRDFCLQFDQTIQSFFLSSFHIQDANKELLSQASLTTAHGGMGLLSLAEMAPISFLASLRNMLSELSIRNSDATDPSRILSQWTYEAEAHSAWDAFHLLPDQMLNQGNQTLWGHEPFLNLSQYGTQHKLQSLYSEAKQANLLSLVTPRKAIKILSASGQGAAAFLSANQILPGQGMSNAELEVAVKLRLGSKIHAHMPHTCICGADIDPEGDHLLKCKRGNEWDTRHTALNQCMASIIRSAHLPVSHEIPIASLAPPRPGFLPPIGRMDLVVTDSDFSTLLADVTITHPNPSTNQAITPAMMRAGYFAQHRENSKNYKYSDMANAIGAKFSPLVLETYGSLGKSFQSLLKSLAAELFRRSINTDIEHENLMKSKLITLWRSRISVTLQKANSRLLLSKLNRTHQAIQRNQPASSVDFSTISSWT